MWLAPMLQNVARLPLLSESLLFFIHFVILKFSENRLNYKNKSAVICERLGV